MSGWAKRELDRSAAKVPKPISFLLPTRAPGGATSQAPCGCKWYADGTRYRCLSHQEQA